MALCQEISFADGICRIEIDDEDPRGGQPFTARMSLVDAEHAESRALVFPTGERVVVKGESEPAALRAAVAYLESRFGTLCEYEHGCSTPVTTDGPPFVVESAASVVDPVVDEASAESFPASDPPTSTPTTGATVKGREL